jgi:hypothetical protein
MKMTTESILQEAERIINGQRQNDYGSPEDNFGFIRDLWNAYIENKYKDHGVLLSSVDVAMMMVLLKVARHAHSPKRDNLVDIAGYAACAERFLPRTEVKTRSLDEEYDAETIERLGLRQ